MKKIDLISEEEILSSLTKDEDRVLMNNLKKLKAIEDVEAVLSKIPFLKKLVSNSGEKRQLTKELLNRINEARKAEDFKYRITEKEVKQPFKKAASVAKEKITSADDIYIPGSKLKVGDIVKSKYSDSNYKIIKIKKIKNYPNAPDITLLNLGTGNKIVDTHPNNEYAYAGNVVLKTDTSENILANQRKKFENELQTELKKIGTKQEAKKEETKTLKKTTKPNKPILKAGDIIPLSEWKIGMRVKRGPDWEWDNQDGKGLGTIKHRSSHQGESGVEWLSVEWDEGEKNRIYRIGRINDIVLAEPFVSKKPKSLKQQEKEATKNIFEVNDYFILDAGATLIKSRGGENFELTNESRKIGKIIEDSSVEDSSGYKMAAYKIALPTGTYYIKKDILKEKAKKTERPYGNKTITPDNINVGDTLITTIGSEVPGRIFKITKISDKDSAGDRKVYINKDGESSFWVFKAPEKARKDIIIYKKNKKQEDEPEEDEDGGMLRMTKKSIKDRTGGGPG